MNGRRLAGSQWGFLALLLLLLSGCGAAYTLYMGGPLSQLSSRDYEGALNRLEKPDGKGNLLLYRLERGLILHYAGQYQLSNQEFQLAEDLIDELYTRSASREVASLLTNDAIRAYRGEEFERVFIHYYRAMNYQLLGKPQDALVECRKANLKLEDYASTAEYELTYRNDAFMQYLTGMLYESEGDLNDAYVSYRHAASGYTAFQEQMGLPEPASLRTDLARVAARLGYAEEAREYGALEGWQDSDGLGTLTAFIETGFVARKAQTEISLPILREDDTGQIWVVSDRLAYRYRHPHAYRRASVSYWLRVAIPEYRNVPSLVTGVRVSSGGREARGVLVEDISAIAMRTFSDKEGAILTRTAARALAKYLASRGIEKAIADGGDDEEEDEWRRGLGRLAGALVNLFGAATEAADTRSWLSLPSRVYMARLQLPPGTGPVQVDFTDASGRIVEQQVIAAVTIEPNKQVFINYRGYR